MHSLIHTKEKFKNRLLKKKNVVGVGVGCRKKNGRLDPNDQCVVVLVEKKEKYNDLKKKDRVPRHVGLFMTDIQEVGKIVALENTERMRPAPGGVSIGHPNITAGTLGVVCKDSELEERVILSNNHVLANSNNAELGDAIFQPGPHDGGVSDDTIGHLLDYVPIHFGSGGGIGDPICQAIASFAQGALNSIGSMLGCTFTVEVEGGGDGSPNLIDAAIALPVLDEDISDEIIIIGEIDGWRDAELGDVVKKNGRTTELTEGSVLQTNVTVQVQYGAGQVATFEDQTISDIGSAGGDSGSLIVGEDNKAVGLLFAGSDTVTIFNPIRYVVELLKVEF